MTEDQETSNRTTVEEIHTSDGAPHWVGMAIVALAVICVVALAVGWNAATRAKGAEQTATAQSKTLQTNVDTLNQRLTQAEETNTQLENELQSVTDRLKTEQTDVTTTRRQSAQIGKEYSKKLDDVKSQLDTKASADDLKALGGDVSGVKTDLDATKNNLDMTRGEFGTLIAKNHDQIDELRRLGERDYFEFTLSGKGNRSKVGSMMVELRGTNEKKNQFTVDLYVDDMRLEKKNRAVDEPIYFYTRGTRTPLEMVVNQVGKDKVVGYLSVPKSQPTTASASASTGGN